jgi:hypothetical protein
MSSASNNLSIYLIVTLNAACHLMLIWRLKLDMRAKVKFCSLAVAIPAIIMTAMRLLVALGVMHLHVADQAGIEKAVTMLASILLLAGPPIATGAAILSRRKSRSRLSQGELIRA